MTRRTTILLTIPLILIAAFAAALLALPPFVASSTHRATIEAAASALTGRHVRIAGALHLTLLPTPEISANNITITGPNAENITATALTLDLSGSALLHGKLSATSITLDHPIITFPWPLPGGPAAIAAPGWLTALHAQMIGATITLGALQFSDLNADIFTGTDGTVSISGTATFNNAPINAAIALAPAGLDGVAPVSLHATQSGTSADFSGTLDSTSTATGRLKLAHGPLHATADITANATTLSARNIALTAGPTTASGTASYHFAGGAITGSIATNKLTAPLAAPLIPLLAGIPLNLTLDATNTPFGAVTIPDIQADASLQSGSLTLTKLSATLPGDTIVTGALTLAPSITGTLTATTTNLPALAAAYNLAAPPDWLAASITAKNFTGTPDNLSLPTVTGTLDNAHFTGRLHLAAGTAYGALHFDSLNLLPLLTFTKTLPPADGELTAAHATIGPLSVSNVLIDGSTVNSNLRRFSANLYHGLAAANFIARPAGISAHGFLLLPAATPLAALLPFPLPPALTAQRFALNAAAAGAPASLSTAASASLGDFTLTTAPTVNILAATAAGALTLRHPNAIRAASFWNLNRGLAWPGPGSLSIRANMALALSEQKFALPDFILSAGTTSATGTITLAGSTLTGLIDATTLALPPLTPKTTLPPLSAITAGKITLNAATIFYTNNPALTATAATLTFAPPTLTLSHATAAAGSLTATLTAPTANALSATLHLANANAAQLPPLPYLPSTGTLTASATLSATGYTFRTWTDTLSGTASATATNGTLPGFTLPAKSRLAATTGSTAFTTYTLATAIAAGTAALTTATATTQFGTVTANGLIDLPDQTESLHLTLPTATVTALGAWSAPKLYAKLTKPPHP
jgi:uncharacterized protein involved in outer membrane biogenesis